jgi:glycosyltransferase involved in cell wall biosynthesis
MKNHDKEDDLVLLICPVRNEGEFVHRLISSIQKQTFNNWKLVFFDNNSTDSTKLFIGEAMEDDKRIELKEFSVTTHINSNFNRSVDFVVANYIAAFVGFIGGDDQMLEVDYLEKLVTSLKNGHSMAIPRHKTQSRVESNSFFTDYPLLSRHSLINVVMQCWNKGYGNLFYSLYRWEDFMKILHDGRSKLTSNLSSDWWFINTALRVIEYPPEFIKTATYIKFDKGYGYDSEYYHAGEDHAKAIGLSQLEQSHFILRRLTSRFSIWIENLVVVPFLIVFRGRDRVSMRRYPELFLMICIMIVSRIVDVISFRLIKIFKHSPA